MAVNRHHDVVVPSFKTFAVLDTGCFAVGIAHGQKDRRLAHTPGNLARPDQILLIGGQLIKKLRVALDALLRCAAAACK